MANDEERDIEEQLELQLQEQRDSISAIKEALAADPTNSELLDVQKELISAIRDAEEGLLELKRARLLQEADLALGISRSPNEDVAAEPIDPAHVEVEPLEAQNFSVGSKCRFRHSDGRWYNGVVVSLEESYSAKVNFLTPTSENMLMCRFFLEQRCRFGANCRHSHGIEVPLSLLRNFVPTKWEQSMVGSTVWANPNVKTGIWKKAELDYLDDSFHECRVVFIDNGSSETLATDSIAVSEYAQVEDREDEEVVESEYSTSDVSDSNDIEEEKSSQLQGLGFVKSTALQKGIQKETAIFAKWENHTRGIASKMMANMGYREGMGLGASGQGMLDPITVKVLPPKQSLEHALSSSKLNGGEEKTENRVGRKKRSRGGKRKRDKKFAEACREMKEAEESTPDVFSLINTQLAAHGDAVNGKKQKKKSKEGEPGREREDNRRSLVAYEDEVKELKVQVKRLEEMADRNKKEKVVYEAAMRKLGETQKTLTEVLAAHASASHAVTSKEKEKKWLKF